ncbi:MAG: CAP domain-containing protein [Candidatus Paceibacterota bacterium]
MFNWLKKHFIPHEGNEHRPHILRDYNIRNIVAVILFLEIFTFLIPTLTHINITGGMAAVLPGVLSILTNEERQSQNLKTLTVSPVLNQVAEMKAKDMATKGYFAHISPEGKTPWYWLEKVGYKYQYAGENLAINFNDSKDVTNAWMASPTHKKNIMKGNYTEIGTGIAMGIYEGRETIFVAQVYANPLSKTETQTEPIKKPTPTSVIREESTNVLGAEVAVNIENVDVVPPAPILQPTLWQKAFSSPRNTMNIILFSIFAVIGFALLLYILVKARQYHLDLITNGLIVLAILGAIFIVNYYFSNKNMVITQSMDYSLGSNN